MVWLAKTLGGSSRLGGLVGKSFIVVVAALILCGVIIKTVPSTSSWLVFSLCLLVVLLVVYWIERSTRFAEEYPIPAFFDPVDIIDVMKEVGKNLPSPPPSPVVPLGTPQALPAATEEPDRLDDGREHEA